MEARGVGAAVSGGPAMERLEKPRRIPLGTKVAPARPMQGERPPQRAALALLVAGSVLERGGILSEQQARFIVPVLVGKPEIERVIGLHRGQCGRCVRIGRCLCGEEQDGKGGEEAADGSTAALRTLGARISAGSSREDPGTVS